MTSRPSRARPSGPGPLAVSAALVALLAMAATASAHEPPDPGSDGHEHPPPDDGDAPAEGGAGLSGPGRAADDEGDDGLTVDERALIDAALQADSDASAVTPPPATPGSQAPSAWATAIQSLNPDMALILDTALAWFSDDPLEQGAHDPNRTGFTLQQLEMHLEASVDPYFELQANIVFAQFGVEVEEAYGRTLGLPAGFQLRAGQFLTRFGRQNNSHPHAWDFADQPFALSVFLGGEGSRGLGAEVSWLAPFPWYFELIVSGTMAEGACCARSFFGGDGGVTDGPEDLVYTAALKQFFDVHEDVGLSWGLSAQLGPNATGPGNRTELYGTDLRLRYRPRGSPNRFAVDWRLEAMLRARQVPGRATLDAAGWSEVIVTFTPQWQAGARYEFGWFDGEQELDPDVLGLRHSVAVQGTFYPSHFARIRVQGGVDLPAWREGPIYSAVLALELLIGAHGAHNY